MTTTRLAGLLALVAATAVRASAPTDHVTYITGERTTAAFAAGQPLVETSTYKVHASRREAPGMAEIHTLDTDIIYVLDGAATVVTGGKAVGTKEMAPNEIRGSAIEGGTPRRLAKGDVFIVPNGVPHWFTDVQSPFLYYVVKVTAAGAGGGSQ
jgi:quercetin dioxygenase-like cupin family protein